MIGGVRLDYELVALQVMPPLAHRHDDCHEFLLVG